MVLSDTAVLEWFSGITTRGKLLALATLVVLLELGLRRFARTSRAYAGWTAFFRAVGVFWTAVLLSIVYVASVGPVSLAMRIAGRDPLDRRLDAEPSFWRPHEPNPLGPEAAARHQF